MISNYWIGESTLGKAWPRNPMFSIKRRDRRKRNRFHWLWNPAHEIAHRCFQMMYKFQRSRTRTCVSFHGRRQCIVRTSFDAQFEISKIVRDRVGRYDFDCVSSRKQIKGKLTRALMGTRDDASQRHCVCHCERSLDARNPLESFLALLLQDVSSPIQSRC